MRNRRRSLPLTACLLLAMLVLPRRAAATLGGNESTVDTDRVRMQGALMNTTRSDAYTMYEVRSASGIVVHEYVSPSGTVFGIAWQSEWMPDLKQLLGPYFDRYQQTAQAARVNRKARGPVTVQTPDVVVQVSGHARAFTGSAYVTQLMPQGVRAESVR
jgi:uncharacterized protein DUF2844